MVNINLKEIRKKKLEKFRKKIVNETSEINSPIEVNTANFDSLIKKHKFIVIDCWSTRCPPCMILGPIIEELAKKHKGKIVFGKLSFDESQNQQIAVRYNIHAIPTLLVFRNGKLADTLIGLMPKGILESKLGLK